MNNYRNVGVGLRKMYQAMIAIIVCTILSLVLSCFPVLSLIATVGILVAFVLDFIGLYHVGKDILLCKVSFFLRIAAMAITVLTLLIPQISGLGYITSMISVASPLLMTVSITKILKERGAASIAKLGWASFWLSVVTDVGTLVLGLIPFLFSLFDFGITGILLIVMLGAAIASLITYMLFLKRGAEHFGSYY